MTVSYTVTRSQTLNSCEFDLVSIVTHQGDWPSSDRISEVTIVGVPDDVSRVRLNGEEFDYQLDLLPAKGAVRISGLDLPTASDFVLSVRVASCDPDDTRWRFLAAAATVIVVGIFFGFIYFLKKYRDLAARTKVLEGGLQDGQTPLIGGHRGVGGEGF